MSELLPILDELLAMSEQGQPCALCAVVTTKGSTPQSPGAAMLLRPDCSTLGTLGGGCVEEEVKRRAHQAVTGGTSALYDFVLNHDYGWDDGLICGGRMDVAVLGISSDTDLSPFRQALQSARAFQPASLPLVVPKDDGRLQYTLHLEVPPTLLIAGAGHVGHAVAKLATDLDFRVVVFDDREEYASADRFPSPAVRVIDDIASGLKHYPIDPSCYVVIVTRGHSHDQQALEAVIRSNAGYIGLIGSRRKAKLIFEDLRNTGIDKSFIERVHTPIGLSIGAVTVGEIAVSITAELIQHRRYSTPKLVEGPISL